MFSFPFLNKMCFGHAGGFDFHGQRHAVKRALASFIRSAKNKNSPGAPRRQAVSVMYSRGETKSPCGMIERATLFDTPPRDHLFPSHFVSVHIPLS
jgi:hypothetical protein